MKGGIGILTFAEFFRLQWDNPVSSLGDCYGFWGAYAAGHAMRGDTEFPLEQSQTAWNTAFDNWLRLAETYRVELA